MGYYRSAATAALRKQLAIAFPLRDTGSDGWIGDTSHQARPSDHNPDPLPNGVVRAEDFDKDGEDGPGGFDLGAWLWDQLLESRDSRISYVIYNGRMFSSYPARGYAAWEPRPYHGTNKHIAHLHLSTKPSADRDGRPWRLLLPTDKPPMEDDMATLSEEDFERLSGDMLRQANKAVRAEVRPIRAQLAAMESRLVRSGGDPLSAAEYADVKRAAAEALAEADAKQES